MVKEIWSNSNVRKSLIIKIKKSLNSDEVKEEGINNVNQFIDLAIREKLDQTSKVKNLQDDEKTHMKILKKMQEQLKHVNSTNIEHIIRNHKHTEELLEILRNEAGKIEKLREELEFEKKSKEGMKREIDEKMSNLLLTHIPKENIADEIAKRVMEMLSKTATEEQKQKISKKINDALKSQK